MLIDLSNDLIQELSHPNDSTIKALNRIGTAYDQENLLISISFPVVDKILSIESKEFYTKNIYYDIKSTECIKNYKDLFNTYIKVTSSDKNFRLEKNEDNSIYSIPLTMINDARILERVRIVGENSSDVKYYGQVSKFILYQKSKYETIDMNFEPVHGGGTGLIEEFKNKLEDGYIAYAIMDRDDGIYENPASTTVYGKFFHRKSEIEDLHKVSGWKPIGVRMKENLIPPYNYIKSCEQLPTEEKRFWEKVSNCKDSYCRIGLNYKKDITNKSIEDFTKKIRCNNLKKCIEESGIECKDIGLKEDDKIIYMPNLNRHAKIFFENILDNNLSESISDSKYLYESMPKELLKAWEEIFIIFRDWSCSRKKSPSTFIPIKQ